VTVLADAATHLGDPVVPSSTSASVEAPGCCNRVGIVHAAVPDALRRDGVGTGEHWVGSGREFGSTPSRLNRSRQIATASGLLASPRPCRDSREASSTSSGAAAGVGNRLPRAAAVTAAAGIATLPSAFPSPSVFSTPDCPCSRCGCCWRSVRLAEEGEVDKRAVTASPVTPVVFTEMRNFIVGAGVVCTAAGVPPAPPPSAVQASGSAVMLPTRGNWPRPPSPPPPSPPPPSPPMTTASAAGFGCVRRFAAVAAAKGQALAYFANICMRSTASRGCGEQVSCGGNSPPRSPSSPPSPPPPPGAAAPSLSTPHHQCGHGPLATGKPRVASKCAMKDENRSTSGWTDASYSSAIASPARASGTTADLSSLQTAVAASFAAEPHGPMLLPAPPAKPAVAVADLSYSRNSSSTEAKMASA
ncbi:hypothetical protein Vafri_5225, partial [Volvox africanus]